MNNPIKDKFESVFISSPLAEQIAHCNHYELAPLFKTYLPGHEPILEAGCGSGRWVAWFMQQGWQAVGLDWSAELCERAGKEIPQGRFIV
ncbi:MAG: class I SAM-dependent methyltransferase, partial [Deltaproteobacteria bacterium]